MNAPYESNVSSTYGAPMGRHSDDRSLFAGVTAQLRRVPAVDYDYDPGGAYWGGLEDNPLWCVWDDDGLTAYFRAKDRDAALRELPASCVIVQPKVTTATCSDAFFYAYVECALWSSNDESDDSGGEPMDRNYSHDDIAPDSLKSMRADCDAFYSANADDLYLASDDQAGHDFWLTRNGHGAGFWDRPKLYGKAQAKRLSAASRKFGEVNLYVGDDGKVYQ